MPNQDDKIQDQEDLDVENEEQEDEEDEDEQEDNDQEEEQEDEEESDSDSEDDEEEEEDDDEEDPADRKTVPIEEYKQLQKSATKWVEKVLHRNKLLTETFKILPKVADNPEELITIFEENPEMAGVILENYYDNMSIEDYAKQFLGKEYTPKQVKKALSEEEIRAQVKQEIMDEQVQDHVATLLAKSNLSEKEKKKVMDEYNELAEGKKLTKEKATKYFWIAYGLVRKTPKKDPDTQKTVSTAPWGKTTKSSKGKTVDPYVQEAKDFLKEFWYH